MKTNSHENSLSESIALYFHITHRNWIVYKKDLIANISPTVADPALILVSLGLGLGSYLSNIQGMTYMQFLAPGLAVATALFMSFFESSYGFYIRMTFENVYKAMLTTQVGIPEVVFGELIWVAIKGAVMAICVSAFLALFGLMTNPWLIPLVGIVGALVSIPCAAMGLIATAKVRNVNQFQTVYSFIIAPLYFLSGIFFPIDQMAPAISFLARFFPLIHGVELSQSIFWDKNILQAMLLNGSALVLQSIVLSFIAYKLIHRRLIS